MIVNPREPYEENMWWESRNFHVIDVSGVERVCVNGWISSIKYGFPIDYDSSESIVMVGNNKVWDK